MNKWNDDNYLEAREESIEYKEKNNEEKILQGLTEVRPEMLDEKAKELFDFIMKKLDELNEYKKVKEKTADEMFEELGYELEYYHYNSDNSDIYTYHDYKNKNFLRFNTANKTFYSLFEHTFNAKELQAINKKVEELGWI